MSTAEMTQTKFLSRLALIDAGHDGEPTQDIIVESSFFHWKEMLDRVLGILMLVPALPLIGLLVLIVRLNSRGPGIFRQVRVGKRGKAFTMYKLRSMRSDAEAATGPAWSPTGGDPRVTRLGFWLRRLHFDELPQLFNVVRGEMSLVGPRPERPEFVEVLAEQLPGYLNRLMVQPGITGLAQINLPPDTDLDSVHRKLILDCEYVRSASLWLDLRIVLCTALRMLWIKGPAVTRLMGLERIVHLSKPQSADGTDSEPAAPVSLSSLVLPTGRKASRHDATHSHGERAVGNAAGASAKSVASPETSN